MRVFILSDANSIHTKRWVCSLAERGINVFLFSLPSCNSSIYNYYSNIEVYGCGIDANLGLFSKTKYLSVLNKLKTQIKLYSPDILHAHYASSYGLLGALSGFHPYVLSVWGSDVYDFPNINGLTKWVLKYNLKKADRILSTSLVMANETKKYTSKEIEVTPFGVDTSLFKRMETADNINGFVIGNVKTLAPKYGIDVLIKAFKIVVDRNYNLPLKLIIVGDGPNRLEYMNLVSSLGIEDKVEFKGKIPNSQLTDVYNSFSVSVSVSNSESFGVVAVEAMACECPVVTSDADGFTEVVEDGVTGFVVPKRDIEATANAIQKFIDNPKLRTEMGKKGRERVQKLYDWKNNVTTMLEIYKDILQ